MRRAYGVNFVFFMQKKILSPTLKSSGEKRLRIAKLKAGKIAKHRHIKSRYFDAMLRSALSVSLEPFVGYFNVSLHVIPHKNKCR